MEGRFVDKHPGRPHTKDFFERLNTVCFELPPHTKQRSTKCAAVSDGRTK